MYELVLFGREHGVRWFELHDRNGSGSCFYEGLPPFRVDYAQAKSDRTVDLSHDEFDMHRGMAFQLAEASGIAIPEYWRS
jgi:hypothetical protein